MLPPAVPPNPPGAAHRPRPLREEKEPRSLRPRLPIKLRPRRPTAAAYKASPAPAKVQEEPEVDQDFDSDSEASFTDKATIEAAIVSIITDNNAEGKETGLGEIGSRLVKIFPDFDVRNYHYSKLSEYLKDFPSLKVENRDNAVWVSLNSSPDSEIEQQILRIFKKHDTDDMYLATLKKELLELNPNLEASIRRSGVTRFSVYLNRMIGSFRFGGNRFSKLAVRSEDRTAQTDRLSGCS